MAGTIEASESILCSIDSDIPFDCSTWGRPTFPTPIPPPTMPPAPYQPRPEYTTPNPYQQMIFIHPVFNLNEAVMPFKGMNNHTPLKMCITAYYFCENYVMKHSVDNRGNPIEITVSYKTLFKEARDFVQQKYPQMPLQMFSMLYKFTRSSERHIADSRCSIYNFCDKFNADWTDDWDPNSCHLDSKYFMNQKMVTGALVIVAGKLAERIPGAGNFISGSLYGFAINQIYEGYQELPEMPPIYPR